MIRLNNFTLSGANSLHTKRKNTPLRSDAKLEINYENGSTEDILKCIVLFHVRVFPGYSGYVYFSQFKHVFTLPW